MDKKMTTNEQELKKLRAANSEMEKRLCAIDAKLHEGTDAKILLSMRDEEISGLKKTMEQKTKQLESAFKEIALREQAIADFRTSSRSAGSSFWKKASKSDRTNRTDALQQRCDQLKEDNTYLQSQQLAALAMGKQIQDLRNTIRAKDQEILLLKRQNNEIKFEKENEIMQLKNRLAQQKPLPEEIEKHRMKKMLSHIEKVQKANSEEIDKLRKLNK